MGNGIRQQVLLLAFLPIVIISAILGSYIITNEVHSLKLHQQEQALALLNNLTIESEFWIAMEDSNALANIANDGINQEIIGIAFYSKNRIELAKVGTLSSVQASLTNEPQTIPHKHSTTLTIPIKPSKMSAEIYRYVSNAARIALNNPDITGWLAIEVSDVLIKAKIFKVLCYSAIIVFIGLIITIVFALRISARLTKPILAISNAVRKIEQGNLSIRVNNNATGELATLESGINTMATALQKAHQELQNNIEQATSDLRHTLETIEIQNIELEISRKEAEAASKIKSEFLANMSHELRTPLNGIIGFINLLLKTQLNARQYDYLLTIQKSSNNLLSIINDVLDFSKIEAGKLSLDIEPMDIRECIEDALTLLAPSAHEKSIEIIPFFYSDVPNLILGDPLRVKQVITNLVSNSIKFTEHGSVIVRLMLEKELPNNKIILRISVEDTGRGLTEEQQKELFHSFNQIDPKITKKFGGTGLGLVICKNLIEQMNGQIDIESTPMKGSNFWFTIEAEKITTTNQNTFIDNRLLGFRVLLLERHPITNLSLKHTLENWGIIVKQATNLENITSFMQQAHSAQTPFHLILVGINQLEPEKLFLEELIQLIQKYFLCPIGLLINNTEQLLYNKKMINGISLCLAKPVCRAKLYEAICNLLIDDTLHSPQGELIYPAKIQLLAVDDNVANLKLITALLESLGIGVTIATNGPDALNLINNQQFSLILMDINMPGMDGIETSRAIRQSNSLNCNTPIVAISAHIDPNSSSEMQNLINDYLRKPINEHQLKATIYKWTHQGFLGKNNTKEHHSTNDKEVIMSTNEHTQLCSLDWELGIKLAADNIELAKDLFAMLIKDLPNEQSLINEAYQNNKYDELKNYVHKLHGGCCYVGVPKLKHLAKSLELAIINNETDKISTLISELNHEIALILKIKVNELSLNITAAQS